MATVAGNLKTKFTDDLGEPLIGGKVYTYHAGTSTPKDSYQDKEFAIVNTNPIVLDDAGSCDLYLNGLYRLRVLDKDGVFVEERDYVTQGDSTGSSITDNANNITVLQSEVQAINERSVLKLDEHNFIIAHGRADSATVYDPIFRADKLKLALQGQEDSARNIFKTYATDTTLDGNEIKAGTYLDPALQAVKLGTAASRLVGTEDGQIPLAEQVSSLLGTVATRNVGTANGQVPLSEHVMSLPFSSSLAKQTTLPSTATGWQSATAGYTNYWENSSGAGHNGRLQIFHVSGRGNSYFQLYLPYIGANQDIAIRVKNHAESASSAKYQIIRTSANTTFDSNGFLKKSSPVLRVFNDRIEGNDDGERMGAKFVKNGIGDYEISGTTGLRSDGWYITIPNDMNGNPKVAVTLEEVDGVISLKSYKRIFDMNEFKFVPGLNEPTDIPDGRWIDLRFNDLPEELVNEPTE